MIYFTLRDQIRLFCCFGKIYFWTECWNSKWNSAIIQDRGCGGQGCYFQPNPRAGHESNVHISWMYRYSFYYLKVHFWWPIKGLKCNISSWHTLYDRSKKGDKHTWPLQVTWISHWIFNFCKCWIGSTNLYSEQVFQLEN